MGLFFPAVVLQRRRKITAVKGGLLAAKMRGGWRSREKIERKFDIKTIMDITGLFFLNKKVPGKIKFDKSPCSFFFLFDLKNTTKSVNI